jgi:hypothetical protein
MTLKREKPKPVDWKAEARARLQEEHADWWKTCHGAIRRRVELFTYFETFVAAENGKRTTFNKLDWYVHGKKIPWAPRGFLG